MNLRPLLNIIFLAIVLLVLNSCAAITAPVNAISSIATTTVNATGAVAGTGISTAGAVVGAPFALMQ